MFDTTYPKVHTHTNIHLEAHYKGMYIHTTHTMFESLAGPSESDESGTQI